MYIISGCLLGENCKYNGENNFTEWVKEFSEKHNFISVCPEIMGGLEAPRPPVEIIAGRAVNSLGEDVTEAFMLGSKLVWENAQKYAQEIGEEIEGAVLKAKSPSCGSGTIYDGTFSHVEVNGDGFLASYLKAQGIEIISENDINGGKND